MSTECICEGKRQSYCIYCRFKKYSKVLRQFSPEERETLEYYRNIPVLGGINAATKNDANLQQLDIIDQTKEAFSFELTEIWREEILTDRPSNKRIFNRARSCTYVRKPSWHTLRIKQKEAFATFPEKDHFLFGYDDEGEILEVGYLNPDQYFCPESSEPFEKDPEIFSHHHERQTLIDQFPRIIAESGKRHAQIYLRIYKLQMSGIEVTEKHRSLLGIGEEEGSVASYKHQLKKLLINYVSSLYDDVAEKHAVIKAQKDIEWNIDKSTFEQRKTLYRDPLPNKFPAKTIRIWNVVKGDKTDHTTDPGALMEKQHTICTSITENPSRASVKLRQ